MIPPLPPLVSSGVQWAAKLATVGVAVWLAERGTLTPEVTAVLASLLVSLGVTNAATLLASASRVVSMVHAFAPGAAEQVATVIASIPPPPPPPPPPVPSSLPKAAAVLGVVAVLAFGAGACGESLMTPADQGATNTEFVEQVTCVRDHSGDQAAIAACRAAVRARWDSYWVKELEGGTQ